ncbi:hypothetical protein [Halosaccharopolyspora lacisalsi]|uniref:hypothetical protein n=1 Tax=Halosaccharopolyspora lacisalsi TaxID=1000566 RepID=UPI0015F9E976|nr:hypothetical protein [Halosaccharopolyspora lacisalsi]
MPYYAYCLYLFFRGKKKKEGAQGQDRLGGVTELVTTPQSQGPDDAELEQPLPWDSRDGQQPLLVSVSSIPASLPRTASAGALAVRRPFHTRRPDPKGPP